MPCTHHAVADDVAAGISDAERRVADEDLAEVVHRHRLGVQAAGTPRVEQVLRPAYGLVLRRVPEQYWRGQELFRCVEGDSPRSSEVESLPHDAEVAIAAAVHAPVLGIGARDRRVEVDVVRPPAIAEFEEGEDLVEVAAQDHERSIQQGGGIPPAHIRPAVDVRDQLRPVPAAADLGVRLFAGSVDREGQRDRRRLGGLPERVAAVDEPAVRHDHEAPGRRGCLEEQVSHEGVDERLASADDAERSERLDLRGPKEFEQPLARQVHRVERQVAVPATLPVREGPAHDAVQIALVQVHAHRGVRDAERLDRLRALFFAGTPRAGRQGDIESLAMGAKTPRRAPERRQQSGTPGHRPEHPLGPRAGP